MTQALLFDLGGVLLDVDFSRAIKAWAPYSSLSLDGLKQAFKIDPHYERHERGELDAGEYFDHLASTLRLSATRDEVEQGWNAIFGGEIARTRRLVESVRRSIPCYVFSNTNAAHQVYWSRQYPEVVAAFDRIFTSHEIGLRKPERAAYDHVCRAMGVPAASVMFFDDLPENVSAAREAGLQAVLVRSPDDVADCLRELGCAGVE
jgi:HAD superfamily hydrolase (TIGR01549 family)